MRNTEFSLALNPKLYVSVWTEKQTRSKLKIIEGALTEKR